MAAATPEQQQVLLDALLGGRVHSLFESPAATEPTLRSIPTDVVGFRVRLDLCDTKPPVWRRLELAGDLTLLRLHEAVQTAMGWTASDLAPVLHRF